MSHTLHDQLPRNKVHIVEQVTLLDSLRKRCHFVEKAVQHIGLQNTNVVWARAEEAGQSQQHREVRIVMLQTHHLFASFPVLYSAGLTCYLTKHDAMSLSTEQQTSSVVPLPACWAAVWCEASLQCTSSPCNVAYTRVLSISCSS